jgi:protein tyrosine phosphatase (PTP) superfamily phosphohydrolase (DUF442 family)
MTLREVYPGLFLSGHTRGLTAEQSIKILAEAGISRVVCVAPRCDDDLRRQFPEADIINAYQHIPLSDGMNPNPDKIRKIAHELSDILRLGRKVLVHCNAGRNRASLVGAMVMREFGISSDEAILRIRATRPTALANPHFEAFLRSLDDQDH